MTADTGGSGMNGASGATAASGTSVVTSDAERARIKDVFIAERGYWRPWTESMLRACPGFVEQYARYAGHPARTGPLSARMVELIYIALDTSGSHLFTSGLQTHMKRALEVGVSEADVFDVLHLVAVQGVSSVGHAADLLARMTGASEAPLGERLQARIDALGPSHGLDLASLARLDPAYVEVLLDFIEQGRPAGGLTPSERTLVLLALHACFTAFDRGAVERLLETALGQGQQPRELLQAIQLGAHLAVHGTALGVTVYAEQDPR